MKGMVVMLTHMIFFVGWNGQASEQLRKGHLGLRSVHTPHPPDLAKGERRPQECARQERPHGEGRGDPRAGRQDRMQVSYIKRVDLEG